MKLNLLPAYVRQRKVNRQMMVLMVFLFLIVNAAMGYWWMQVKSQLSDLQDQKVTLETQASQVDTLVQQASSRINEVTLTLTKVAFIDAIQKWNPKYPELYSEIAQYTSPRVRYEAMQVAQGNQLQITAVTKDIPNIGLFLQTMYKCPRLAGVSLTTSTEGYQSGGTGGTQAQFGGFGGGTMASVPQGPMVAGAAAAGGGMAPPPGFGGPGLSVGGFGGSGSGLQTTPTGMKRFQIVCLLKEPMMPPPVPSALSGAGGAPGAAPPVGGFGGPPPSFGGPAAAAPPPAAGRGPGGGVGGAGEEEDMGGLMRGRRGLGE